MNVQVAKQNPSWTPAECLRCDRACSVALAAKCGVPLDVGDNAGSFMTAKEPLAQKVEGGSSDHEQPEHAPSDTTSHLRSAESWKPSFH